MPESILLRNPRILEVVEEELRHGAGRNATEVAENLVFAGAENRRMARAGRTPAPSPRASSGRKPKTVSA